MNGWGDCLADHNGQFVPEQVHRRRVSELDRSTRVHRDERKSGSVGETGCGIPVFRADLHALRELRYDL